MKKNIFVALLITVFLTLQAYSYNTYNSFLISELQDETFTSEEGKFSVIPPTGFGKFEYSERRNTTDAGEIVVRQYSQSSDRNTCIIAFYDIPESLFQTKSIEKMLEDGRDGALARSKGILDKETAITVDGNPGISFYSHIETQNGTVYARSDYVIAKPRVYNYLYLSLMELELHKNDVKNFFSSFHIQK